MDRDDTAAILGLPPERVRIVPSAVGGGFGTKLDLSVQPLLGLAALATGRPVRMTFTRPESMRATTKRHPSRITAPLGCDADGRLTALDFEAVFDTGAYASWGPTVANRVPVHATGPYRVPAVAATRPRRPHPRPGLRRLPRLRRAAGRDRHRDPDRPPRRRRRPRPARLPPAERPPRRRRHRHRPAARRASASSTASRSLRPALARRPRAPPRHNAQRPARPPRRRPRRLPGTAAATPRCRTPRRSASASPATARVVLHQGAIDIGQGSSTVIAQIAADALGLPLAAFRFVAGDTHLTPDAGKTSASRQTVVSGRAAEAAARCLRAAILRHANAGPDARLALDAGRIAGRRRPQPSTSPPCPSTPTATSSPPRPPGTRRPRPLDADGQGIPYAVYGTGAQLAELEVDTALGTVRLTRITAAHDVGRAINPTLAEGQIEGGIAMGIGMALMEEYLPGPHRQPARLPDPDDRRRPRDRPDPDREARPRGPVRRPRPRRAHADPDRARHPQRHPPRHRRRDRPRPRPARPRPRRDPPRKATHHDAGHRSQSPRISYRLANLESSRFPPTGGKPAKKQCAHRALLLAAKAARALPGKPAARGRPRPRPAPGAAPMNAPPKLRCEACPVRCYIAPGQTGACDRYTNDGGRIVRTDPLTVLDRTLAAGRPTVPFATDDWDGSRRPLPDRHRRRHHLPRLQARPLHRLPRGRGRRRRHRRHRGDLLLLRRQGEDRHRPPPRRRGRDGPRRRRTRRPRHHRRVRLADALARRRRASDRRLEGRGPRHLRHPARALRREPVDLAIDGGATRHRRRRPAAGRRRPARDPDARRLRLGRDRHVREPVARPRRRGRRRRRPHHRRRLRAPGGPRPRLAALRHPRSAATAPPPAATSASPSRAAAGAAPRLSDPLAILAPFDPQARRPPRPDAC